MAERAAQFYKAANDVLWLELLLVFLGPLSKRLAQFNSSRVQVCGSCILDVFMF